MIQQSKTEGKATLNRKIDLFIIKKIDQLDQTNKISSKGELYEKMRINRQNYYRVKKGYAHFTLEHYYRLCQYLNLDANFIKDIS